MCANERNLTTLAALALTLSACSPQQPPSTGALPTAPVRITQFYTTTPTVARGEQASICYGVDAAESVRIEPPVEELVPSVARCFQFKPQGDTYKLIAHGKRGDEVSQTITIGAGVAAPRFLDLQVNATTVSPGQPVQFCFKATGATRVTGSPGTFAKGGQPSGDCLSDNPRQTTTYRLTITNAAGQQDSDSITVQVK